MKLSSGPVYNTIRNDSMVTAIPVVYAEWNYNRYYNTVVDNTPAEIVDPYNPDLFPIASIAEPHRPHAKGIIKGVVGQAKTASTNVTTVPSARYHASSIDDKYKYWKSSVPSGDTAPYDFPLHSDTISVVRPRVEYQTEAKVNTTVKCNKIVVAFEDTWSSPDSFDVQIKTSTGGAWTTISTNPAMGGTGRFALYYNGTSWTTTENLAYVQNVFAIQLVVKSMDKAHSYLNLIEISARLERDISADVTDISDTVNLGDVDFISPMGTVSSNTGSISLFNDDGKYSNTNPASEFFNMLDKGVKFRAFYNYSGTMVQEFEMYSDVWTEDFDSTAVSIVDDSAYLQLTKPPRLLYQNISVQAAAWKVLDSIGFTKYKVTQVDTSPNSMLNIFWTTGEQTVWEVLQEISRATQSAFYFDSAGFLQIRTRDATWNSSRPADWNVRQVASGVEQPDIVSLTSEANYEANTVKVNYQPTGFSKPVYNIIPYEVVWQSPDDTVALRASPLTQDLLAANTTAIWVSPDNAATWPYSGMCQIEGEWISYEGKNYAYYNASNVKTWGVVKSLADQKKFDVQTPSGFAYMNKYTGELFIKLRGLQNTAINDHKLTLTGWNKDRVINYATVYPDPAGIVNNTDSTVKVAGINTSKVGDYTYLHRGNAIDEGWLHMGTRMKIENSGPDKNAGIFFNGDGGRAGAGYYVDIMGTSQMTGSKLKSRNEVLFYSMKADGSKKNFGGESGFIKNPSKKHGKNIKIDKGADAAIVGGVWFTVDVHFSKQAGTPYNHYVKIYVNGQLKINTTIPAAGGWQHNFVSRFGLFARGNSAGTFEYIYGTSISDFSQFVQTQYEDQSSFYDVYTGGYIGEAWFRDWVYNTRSIVKVINGTSQTIQQRYAQRFFDEFGPFAHEIREFKVDFDVDKPIIQSKLFNTNDSQAVVVEYNADSFGARFVMANAARQNAIVQGDDETLGADNSVTQDLFVYGRPVIQDESITIDRTDDWALRRRGVIDIAYDSKWIQNEDSATALADWLTTHWSRSDSSVSAEIFGNPLIELCDVVGVQYEDMTTATHLFYVVGTNTSFSDGGISTTLTLRRVTT